MFEEVRGVMCAPPQPHMVGVRLCCGMCVLSARVDDFFYCCDPRNIISGGSDNSIHDLGFARPPFVDWLPWIPLLVFYIISNHVAHLSDNFPTIQLDWCQLA